MIRPWARVFLVLPIAALMLGGSVGSQTFEYEFESFEVPGAIGTWAFHINPQGHVAGRYTDGTIHCGRSWHGFVWRNGEFEYFDVPGSYATFAEGISARGEVTGRFSTEPDYISPDGRCNIIPRRAFVRTRDGEFREITVPDAVHPGANQVTNSGMLVGPFVDAGCTWGQLEIGCIHGYLLKNGAFYQIDYPGSRYTDVRSLNARGDIVGEYRDSDGRRHGFLLSRGAFSSVDYPGATVTTLNDINASGDSVGCASNSEEGWRLCFVLSHGQFTAIQHPDGHYPTVWGISPAGALTGFWTGIDGIARSFVARKR